MMIAVTIGGVMSELSYSESFSREKLHQISQREKKFYTKGSVSNFIMHEPAKIKI